MEDDSFQHIQFGDGDGKVREAMKVFVGSLMYKTTLQLFPFPATLLSCLAVWKQVAKTVLKVARPNS